MAATDAYYIQGMNGAVPVTSGQTFTGLTRGVFLFGTGTYTLTAVAPNGAVDPVTVTMTVDAYVPGSYSVVAAGANAICYPDSSSYTVA